MSAIANCQEIGALAGVAHFDKQSGKSDRKRTTRGGRTGARTAGYMAALSAQRCNPIIKAFAARLKANGKPFKVINGRVHSEAVYAPERPVENRYGCGTLEPPKQTFEELTLNTDAVPNWLQIGSSQIVSALGASWTSLHHGGGIRYSQHAGKVIVADGTHDSARPVERVLTNDHLMGDLRHADAGCDLARECAAKHGIQIPCA